MRRLTLIVFLLLLFFAQSSAQPLAFQSEWSADKVAMLKSDSVETGAQLQKPSSTTYKSPFGIKFLSGVGGLALGSLTSSLFLRGGEPSPGLSALALLLITFGCAGGVMISGESYGDSGSFFLSWLGSIGGVGGSFLLASAFSRNFDTAVTVASIGAALLAPLFSVLLYDLSRTTPQSADSGSLLNIRDGKLVFSRAPSVSASYQHPSMLYSVKLIQVQF